MKRTLFLLFGIWTGLSHVAGQLDYYTNLDNLKFSRITQRDGLSHNNIECIYKDADGFVWFGTRNGLCQFNGYEIKVFHSDNKPGSLSGDRILSIAEDKEGYLWIGTYSYGLNRYDKKTGRFYNYRHIPELKERINHIKVFDNGQVWVCSNQGLARYVAAQDTFVVYRANVDDPESLLSDYVHDITQTRENEIFVACESDDIQKFNPETEKFTSIGYTRHPEYTSNYRKRIVEDLNGKLWISANIHGLVSLDPKTGESELFIQSPGQLSTNILTGDMAVDHKGRIWICTDGGGINIVDPETRKFQYINKSTDEEQSLSTDHIYAIYFDEQHALWVGTFAEGINYYNPSRYKFRGNSDHEFDFSPLTGKSVLSIFQDSRKTLWIGTDGDGLYSYSPEGKLTIYLHKKGQAGGLTTNVITSINEDSQGQILVGTYSGGLLSLNPETGNFKLYNTNEPGGKSPSSGSIWHIMPDSRGRIWLGMLGTAADLFNQEDGTFENFGPASGKPDRIQFENVMTLLEDADGDIWFGTEGDGIYILDAQSGRLTRIETHAEEDITTHGIIKSLYQDRWGKIWIGSEGKGLYRLNKKTLELARFTVADGLPNNIVQSIAEDSQGNLWLGTSNGLAMLNPSTGTIRSFVEQDGLSGNEFNQNALLRLEDGRLIIGSSKGVDIFRAEEIKFNQNLPRVVLSKLEVLNNEVTPGEKINGKTILEKNIIYTDHITLTHHEKTFSLEFAALNYVLPGKCKYKYKLEGFDENWTETSSTIRRASYSNLLAGEYQFRVKASNNDGKWGNNERTLRITVLPPFYKSWWFRTLLVLFISGMLYFMYQYRLNITRNTFLKTQAQQEKKIMALEKEKLESELQKMTFHIINRNRVLIDQKNRLMGLSVKARDSVKGGLQDIISIIDEDLNDEKDWVYIEPQLDKVYNNFVTRLKEKHPDLTISEIRIAAYVRMNLSTKEISEFMHKTIRAVENDRYRLRKKIGLESNDSLSQYLMDL